MTNEEFDAHQARLIEEVIRMRDTKGKEYANSKNRFSNFDRLAAQLEMKNYQIGWVYLAKHLDSIASYCRTGEVFSTESIRGRIIDAITYLTLLSGMIFEHENQLVVNQYKKLDDANIGKHQPFEYDPTQKGSKL